MARTNPLRRKDIEMMARSRLMEAIIDELTDLLMRESPSAMDEINKYIDKRMDQLDLNQFLEMDPQESVRRLDETITEMEKDLKDQVRHQIL